MMIKLKLFFLHKMLERGRKKSRKRPPWLGTQFFIPRTGKRPVETFLYEPENKQITPMPVMFNIHGGAWVGSDATCIDTQSQEMADLLSCYVVNINYTKLDVQPFPYPQQEIADTVLYFADHAESYEVDAARFNLIGYSAGGHLCAGTALLLRDVGFSLCCNIPVYPFLNMNLLMDILGTKPKVYALMEAMFFKGGVNKNTAFMSPGSTSADNLKEMSPTELILCGPDELYQQGLDYATHLRDAGVDVRVKIFERSTHGFMEDDYSIVMTETKKIQQEEYDASFLYLKERMWDRWDIDHIAQCVLEDEVSLHNRI